MPSSRNTFFIFYFFVSGGTANHDEPRRAAPTPPPPLQPNHVSTCPGENASVPYSCSIPLYYDETEKKNRSLFPQTIFSATNSLASNVLFFDIIYTICSSFMKIHETTP